MSNERESMVTCAQLMLELGFALPVDLTSRLLELGVEVSALEEKYG